MFRGHRRVIDQWRSVNARGVAPSDTAQHRFHVRRISVLGFGDVVAAGVARKRSKYAGVRRMFASI